MIDFYPAVAFALSAAIAFGVVDFAMDMANRFSRSRASGATYEPPKPKHPPQRPAPTPYRTNARPPHDECDGCESIRARVVALERRYAPPTTPIPSAGKKASQ